ncbi:hypothetical protein [Aquicella lusitana]|uniref:Uncharacterized protein n=1 Tax=Aquicella lusitana TaxID=254246 RepID=A0A370G2Q0_9COXI|nr:hypothetical protein [Aquicella lusitana]RDI37510.1 hypothetical protein C8D86_13910 [Aquicella lusitana]VVC72626.1 hypothetical protein AQULUS_03400 [Aquicella lusitana]
MNDKNETQGRRSGRLTVLELMAVISVLGILLTWVVHHFLTS